MTGGMEVNGGAHLSDEHLSWYVDGSPVMPDEDAPEHGRTEAHLAGCEPCRQRLHSFERARALVRTPLPPVAPAVRAGAVSAVLRSWAAEGESQTPVADPKVADDDRGLASIGALRMRRRRPGFIGAAAAAAALVVVGVGVLVANVVPSSNSSTASRAANAPPSTTVPGFSNAPSAAGSSLGATTKPFGTFGQAELGGASAPLMQLGSVSSQSALRSTVNRVLSGLNSLALGSTATTGAPADHNEATPSATGPATTVPGANAAGASGGVTQDAALPSALQSCLSSALRATGGSRRIELAGSALYRGTSSLVYVFSPSTGALPSASSTGGPTTSKGATVLVVARHGCGVLTSTTL